MIFYQSYHIPQFNVKGNWYIPTTTSYKWDNIFYPAVHHGLIDEQAPALFRAAVCAQSQQDIVSATL